MVQSGSLFRTASDCIHQLQSALLKRSVAAVVGIVNNAELTPTWSFDGAERTLLTNSVLEGRRLRVLAHRMPRPNRMARSATLHEVEGELDLDFYCRGLTFTLTLDQRDGFNETIR